ncbi:hypothetical protein [uncultured Croceitalea sp.]|uniref:hypothetical protein n=1 Tax=uncultured Croceitalea sp. TaxID=1798908 RepID=UPI003305B5DE
MRFIKMILLLSLTPIVAQNQIEVKSLVNNFPGNGALTIAADGTILVNEYGTANADISGSGTRIFSVRPDGKYDVLLNNVSGAIGGTFDTDGTFYFNNRSSYTGSDLMRFKDGNLEKIATLPGFAADLIVARSNGNLLITNYTMPALYQVDTEGNVSEFINDDRLKGCTGITYGEDKTIFVSNFSTGKIYKIDNHSMVEFASVPVQYPGYVVGYITYFEKNIYATGYGASKIYQINMKGEVGVLAGSGNRQDIDGDAKNSSFFVPNGIEIDTNRRRLYISQNGNGQPKSLRYIDLPKP